MRLETWHTSVDKANWKLVRLDDYTDVPGDIVAADEETGECKMHICGEIKTLSFGPNGIRILNRRNS